MRTTTTAKRESIQPFSLIRSPLLQRKCACGNSAGLAGQCSECQGKKLLQRRANDQTEGVEVPPIVHEVLRSTGQPLDSNTRAFMESRLNYDFSSVRVHTGERAAKSAQAVNAQAYTVRQNVVFGKGQYAPETPNGRHLLAHELTHVVQQGIHGDGLPQTKLAISSEHDASELEADRIASSVASSSDDQQSVPIATHRTNAIQRAIGDGHDLTSPRFAGDPTLEACYDDEARLTKGMQGESVRKVQQALIDLGYNLGPTEADGIYGDFTWNAVKQFKANEKLGWEQMGNVGPGTMQRLDDLFSDLPICSEDDESLYSPVSLVNLFTAKAQLKVEPTAPSNDALNALKAAQLMKKQTTPAIWFDSWYNDERDNNLNGKIDGNDGTKGKLKEIGAADGSHYWRDKGIFDAKICSNSSDRTDSCPITKQLPIKVQYMVCIDIPREAYMAAGISMPTTRWIPTFFSALKSRPDWIVWKTPAKPSTLLDGDIVAAANPDHQHAGMVETGLLNYVINLPGPTSARKYGVFKPSGQNDMVSVPRIAFEAILGIDYVARHIAGVKPPLPNPPKKKCRKKGNSGQQV